MMPAEAEDQEGAESGEQEDQASTTDCMRTAASPPTTPSTPDSCPQTPSPHAHSSVSTQSPCSQETSASHREFDARVKAMEVVDRPSNSYGYVGGMDKRIKKLIKESPGTGKTTMARVMAAQSKATFIRLAGTQLTQMIIGEGAKLVRDAFTLARQKAPTIIFIDEIDVVDFLDACVEIRGLSKKCQTYMA